MIVNETVYQNTESVRKQPTMPSWTYLWLKKGDDEVMSKGVKAYEALLFANKEYEDSATNFEVFIDDRLTSIASDSLLTAVEKIKYEKAIGNVERFATDHADFDSDERADHVNIHLPKTLTEQLTVERGIGDHIADAVYALVESAYRDRMDRIQCKKELIEFLEDKRRIPSHNVARAIVDGDSNLFDVDEAHQELNFVRSDGWWDSDTLTVETLREKGSEISDKQRPRKIQAFQTAVENSDEERTKSDLIALAEEAFSVGSSTAEQYVEDLDIDVISSDQVKIDTETLRRRIIDVYDYVGTEYSEDPTGYLNLDDGDLIDEVRDTKSAIEYLEDTQSKMSVEGLDDETRQNRISQFQKHLEIACDVVKGNTSGSYVEQEKVVDLNPE